MRRRRTAYHPNNLGFREGSAAIRLAGMSRTARARAEAEVIRQCRRGLDLAGVQRQVLWALRRVVAVDAAFFATADPETLLFTSAHAEDPLPAATPLFLANEFGGRDVNQFAALARAPTHVGSLDGSTHRDRAASRRYLDILRPLGLGDELRAALVVDRACWGYLCLHRQDDPRGFSTAEVALVARLGPHIAHAVRQAALLHQPDLAQRPRPGVVLLDERLDVIASTPEADDLLSLIDDDGSTGLPLPLPVYSVAAPLADPARGALRIPSVHVPSRRGRWLNLHASWLDGPPGQRRIAVVVEPAEPQASVTIMLAAHGLSSREQDVARLVLGGLSTAAISDALHISTHTVQDHLKVVFDKTGVRSRRELVGLLLAGSHGHRPHDAP